jgi:hypothetical protein
LKKARAKNAQKKLSRQVVRGQQGINLIERVVLAMHCTWTPTGATEVGIDGYIELFDPGSQHPLGKSLGVQSKVLATFSNERDESFDYYCTERDLEYWLRGNLPVLLIVSRPDKGEAYWLSIKEYFNTPERIAARKAHLAKPVATATLDARLGVIGCVRRQDGCYRLRCAEDGDCVRIARPASSLRRGRARD